MEPERNRLVDASKSRALDRAKLIGALWTCQLMKNAIIAFFMLGYCKYSGIPLPRAVSLNRSGTTSSLLVKLVKRITIAMTDELYLALLEYSADESRKAVKKISLGMSMRSLMSSRLEELGYGNRPRAPPLHLESRSY
jgi:hypothetical protein